MEWFSEEPISGFYFSEECPGYPDIIDGESYIIIFNGAYFLGTGRQMGYSHYIETIEDCPVHFGEMDDGSYIQFYEENPMYSLELYKGEVAFLNDIFIPNVYKTITSVSENLETEIETKMVHTNPSGSGSLSLNRQEDSQIGENSCAVGYGTIAEMKGTFVAGQYNISEGIFSEKTSGTPTFYHKEPAYNSYNPDTIYYYGTGYTFDSNTGKYTLINTKQITGSSLPFDMSAY
jgi:hypothetical protein